ncbi:hypothetical protein [Paenibacillus herberti]|uniref:PilZ domain-containing protein n=1 Tax=Paenibacillus herberti TaxID=1619309 RepID=A0A229NV42_9BACL|nr:hypothetical protein [Paenibacillus herberti]OXM13700.1 hypothetical protein CGZ75_22030 [Paenibacillus herberti]
MVICRNTETRADAIPRVRLNRQLLADLHISQVRGEAVVSSSRKVLLHHMSTDGLEFSTTLRFPVDEQYRLTFSVQMGRKIVQLSGIVTSRAKQNYLYEYDLRILDRSISRTEWIKELNEWILRHRPSLPEHKVHYAYRNLN